MEKSKALILLLGDVILKLVIAEKPSVAQSLAKVIGATNKKDGYLEGNGFIVSWCIGHLIELADPEKYDEKYSKWRKEDLPIFPAPFSYQVTASTKKQYQVLKDLMKRPDIDGLIEATDVGRILRTFKIKKNVEVTDNGKIII